MPTNVGMSPALNTTESSRAAIKLVTQPATHRFLVVI